MAKILRFSDFSFEDQLDKASQNYPQFLKDSYTRLKDQLVDVMLESHAHPEIDEILKLLAFIRSEMREHYAKSKRS